VVRDNDEMIVKGEFRYPNAVFKLKNTSLETKEKE